MTKRLNTILYTYTHVLYLLWYTLTHLYIIHHYNYYYYLCKTLILYHSTQLTSYTSPILTIILLNLTHSYNYSYTLSLHTTILAYCIYPYNYILILYSCLLLSFYTSPILIITHQFPMLYLSLQLYFTYVYNYIFII